MKFKYFSAFIRAAIVCLILPVFTAPAGAEGPSKAEVVGVMKTAAAFMADSVSVRGGYVYQYSADLTEQWGEIPARPSQIWTQPPGTPTVGMTFLDAWRATGDKLFLECAERAAEALVAGQHPAGGWHYLIDFDMPGLERWYEEVASKCWGWEEYLHYYGNCSFDDEATTAPTELLMELYMETGDPRWRAPLLKALDFILEAQYPNGAWPQRYPVKREFLHGGHPDYTGHYTFNDGVIPNNILLLVEAWEELGDERFIEAARRGMDFYIASQMANPQGGWADQYDHDMKPAWGRMFEPPAVGSGVTIRCIRELETFYTITGDRRYLRPIPDAIAWLERSKINDDRSKTYHHPYFGRPRPYTHAYYYEPGTNEPIYAHRSGTGVHDEKFWITHDFENMYPYGPPYVVDLEGIRKEFERIRALSPEEAHAEYEAKKASADEPRNVTSERAREIVDALDPRGCWITGITIPDYLNDALYAPRTTMQGINIRVFNANMEALTDYIRGLKGQ